MDVPSPKPPGGFVGSFRNLYRAKPPSAARRIMIVQDESERAFALDEVAWME
jgi:hypothetical protein